MKRGISAGPVLCDKCVQALTRHTHFLPSMQWEGLWVHSAVIQFDVRTPMQATR